MREFTMTKCALWVTVLILGTDMGVIASPWSPWWSYEGHTGPKRWGFLNPDWMWCRSGKFQSPIDIEPRLLLFDPRLRRLSHDIPSKINGVLRNTGNDLTFYIDDVGTGGTNFSGGPLLYGYKAFQVKIHIGKTNQNGSEHKIDGRGFAAEIQILCYNTNLFKKYEDALKKPYGIAIMAIMAEIGPQMEDVTNEPFHHLVTMASRIPWAEQGEVKVQNFDLKNLIPKSKFFVTYEGSLTQPGCYETATWVLFNKPIFVTTVQLDTIRQLQKSSTDHQVTLVDGNLRPVMPINNRVLRTNINYPHTRGICDMKKVTYYQVNEAIRR